MADNLFLGLPPPSARPPLPPSETDQPTQSTTAKEPTPAPPVPILKSALKRSKPSEPQIEVEPAGSKKRLTFKTTVDASEKQVIEAMQKIKSHITNPSKFSKASKLAIQLIQAGSVNAGTSDHFIAILEAAMSSTTACTNPSLRADYHALFSTAQDVIDCLNKKQKNQVTAWTVRAVLGNDLYTDDSFVFSKAAGRVKEAILGLPAAAMDEDEEEAKALEDEKEIKDVDSRGQENMLPASEPSERVVFDPFGLDALLPGTSKTDERANIKKDGAALIKKAEEESKRFFKSQREALILCLEIAAHRYKLPWCQTVIDILVKHAFENKERFTSRQRDAIEKLWTSIREQQNRRKQGKSITGKLDMNAFESLQEKYANEKISIRRAVGGNGSRRAQQWLG
ncbi:hypothetical protein MKW94_026584 [Papaver nudicaule]|uniref:Uncharacterized protein n=1 Tax=Papaver nudicaule TaxID=74823 RepID=A0AA41VBT9_PAPNU|nr:hypothetical protein [Papaver nudicaule]